ncbi:hypothetical protein F5882DRAFT_309316, partial [Hyaloscypha sp. PMI_1271]
YYSYSSYSNWNDLPSLLAYTISRLYSYNKDDLNSYRNTKRLRPNSPNSTSPSLLTFS